MDNKSKKRLIYGVSALIIFITEVIIALFIKDSFIRPYGGDILVVILICCIVRTVLPEKLKLLSLWVFVFALCVELAQLINVVSLLGLEHIEFFRILIGTSFSFLDILCYAVGCVIFWSIEKIVIKKRLG